MIRIAVALLIGAASSGASAQQPAAAAKSSARDSTRTAMVTYIAGQSIYVGAGRLDGVREAMAIELLRGGRVAATLRVTYLASHSAACEIVSSTAVPAVGDTVRYQPAKDQQVALSGDSVAPPVVPRSMSSSWKRPVRGRIGIGYLSVSQPNAAAGANALTQPSADVHVDGAGLVDGLIGFSIDARSRRMLGVSAVQPGSFEQRTLVYESSLSFTHTESGARVSIGRQYSAALSSVGLFDGVTAELNRPRWGVGAFSGSQPDVTTMSFSTAVRENGAYVQVHNRPDGDLPWSVVTGAIASRDLGQVDREFGFTQVSFNSRIVSLYAMQEVDVNRGWKRTIGEPAVSPTSTFASIWFRPLDELSIQGGVDNRRTVWLYRDYVSPETVFDDAFRQGIWGGASYSILHLVRVDVDARMSHGGAAGQADSYTGSLGIGPVLPVRLEVRTRSTSYRTDQTTGWLHALSVGADPIDLLHVELNGGGRTQNLTSSLGSTTNGTPLVAPANAWLGASVDVNLTRWWYFLVSATHDAAGVEGTTNLFYSSLSFRF